MLKLITKSNHTSTHIYILLVTFFFSMGLIYREAFAEDKNQEQAIEEAESTQATDNYVHRWTPQPKVTFNNISGGKIRLGDKKDKIYVSFFLATYCVPCQSMTSKILELEKKYRNLYTEFNFIFVSDQKSDVRAFVKEHQISGAGIATESLEKAFNFPKLPTIYVSDRQGWLTAKIENPGLIATERLDKILRMLTVL